MILTWSRTDYQTDRSSGCFGVSCLISIRVSNSFTIIFDPCTKYPTFEHVQSENVEFAEIHQIEPFALQLFLELHILQLRLFFGFLRISGKLFI